MSSLPCLADTLAAESLDTGEKGDTVSGLLERLERLQIRDQADRYSLYPIRDVESYEYYQMQESSIWSVRELDFARDIQDYEALSVPERNLLDKILAFFSASDGLVIDNICLRFLLEAPSLESRMFYIVQNFIEAVHAETYSITIDTLIQDRSHKEELFRAASTMPCIMKKNDWMKKYMLSGIPKSYRLLVYACAEGIFFTAAFLYIFYFRSRGKMQNVTFANEQISKDERLHRDFGIMLYRRDPIPEERAQALVRENVELECAFAEEILPVPINGLNSKDAQNYVRLLGDHLLISCGHQPIWNVDQSELPAWINDVAMEQKGNFYEVRIGNYQNSSRAWRRDPNPEVYNAPQSIPF